jgi:HD-like signal output (HDOD) protein
MSVVYPADNYPRFVRRQPLLFKGDISKFMPADLLLFLAHLNKDGVLAVTKGSECLSFSFRGGLLIDAQSEAVDDRILRILQYRNLISTDIFDYINRARKETNLPLIQVLENLEWLSAQNFREVLRSGIAEALFQLFLWDTGQFAFTEISVEQSPLQNAHNIQNLVLEITRQVDEYRDILNTLNSLDCNPVLTVSGQKANGAASVMSYVLHQATGTNSIRRILTWSPHPSYDIIKAVEKAHSEGWIELIQKELKTPSAYSTATHAVFFQAYKRSLKKMLQSKDVQDKMTEFVYYCRSQFDYTLVIATKGKALVRCTKFSRGTNGRIESSKIQNIRASLDLDSIFHWVHEAKLPYFGKTLPSKLLKALGEDPPFGECSIIPLGKINDLSVIIYVVSAEEINSPGPLQYLELMSWQMHIPSNDTQLTTTHVLLPDNNDPSKSKSLANAQGPLPSTIPDIVAAMKELPPMPGAVTRVLELVSDVNCKTSSLAEALSHDQALVARLIKVSNSALYGGGQKTSTLSQALVRLGTRTLRSLVVTASTRSLFPTDQTNIGLWGQSQWQHSIECGLASRRIAKSIRYADPEEAFIGGVLHDIGKVVILLKMPEAYRRIRKEQLSEKGNALEAENEILGIDHTQIGEMLLQQWNVPQGLSASVRFHHYPQNAGEFSTLAYIIACGDYLSHT